MIDTVIFDMDGVIVDLEEFHLAAFKDVLSGVGQKMDDSFYFENIGVSTDDIFRKQLRSSEDIDFLAREKEKKARYFMKGKILPKPGVMELLIQLKKNKKKTGLASSADRDNVLDVLKELGIRDFFQVIMTGDDVSNKKPDPEIFLKTAEKLKSGLNECIVIEDSLPGIIAAKSANMKCIAVKNRFVGQDTYGDADLIVNDLTAVNLDIINNFKKGD